ncbi:MAG: hypothetical protein AAFS04_17250 [Cyanobacteria bacterium J06631_9]
MGHSLHERITAFEQSLKSLEKAVLEQSKLAESPKGGKLSSDGTTAQTHALQGGFQAGSISQQANQLQAQFQEMLTAATNADMPPQIEQRIRPFKTEAHRRLRLLGVEAIRFQAAKQPANIEKCREQMQAHLLQVRQFIQAIADTIEPNK